MNRLPLLLLVLAIALASFAYGSLVGRYKLFPFSVLSDSVKTLRTMHELHKKIDDGRFKHFAEVPPDSAASNRFEFVASDALNGPILWHGGRYQFLDYCPDWGCLAVEFTATGQVAHAYPFRSDELEQAANAARSDEFPYELSPAFSFARDTSIAGISRYMNGDLLVVFRFAAFPFGAGVARVDPPGIRCGSGATTATTGRISKKTASRWCPACWLAASP